MVTVEKKNAEARQEKRIVNFFENSVAEDRRMADAKREWCKRNADRIKRFYASRGENWDFDVAFGK